MLASRLLGGCGVPSRCNVGWEKCVLTSLAFTSQPHKDVQTQEDVKLMRSVSFEELLPIVSPLTAGTCALRGGREGEVCLGFEVIQSACWLDGIQPEGLQRVSTGRKELYNAAWRRRQVLVPASSQNFTRETHT